MNFCLIMPVKNEGLFKPTGLIPYYMYKECGYSVKVITPNIDDYSNLKDLPGFNLEFMEEKYSIFTLNAIRYLRKHAKDIDILMSFKFDRSCILFMFYKLFNSKGITYHKMDIMWDTAKRYTGNMKGFVNWIKHIIFLIGMRTVIDFASCETKKMYNLFMNSNEICKEKIIYVPIYITPFDVSAQKKNQIISVGRIGNPQKASDSVLQSFKKALESHLIDDEWILKMVGPISEEFYDYIDDFFIENPNLKNKIVFLGNVSDKTKLYTLFQESKIFLLPSRWESSGIVFVEAAFYENYLIITNTGLGKQLLSSTNFGKLVEIDNIEQISDAIVDAVLNYEKYCDENKEDIKKIVYDEHSPQFYSHIIDNKIKSILNSKKR